MEALLTAQLPAILADFPSISLVYLFGSQVSGQTGPMSDIDLAIYDESGEDPFARQMEFQYRMVKLVGTDRVDVVLLNRAPIELAYRVIASGKLLYMKDKYTQVEYEADTLSKYGDFLPMLRAYKQRILEGETHARRVQRYRETFERTQRTLGSFRTPPE
jgi:predicted nucleotidyltransferase